jgi:DNA mismatch endonuclease, patch repair protein
MDNLDPLARSRAMAAIKGKDTAPERLVRKALHAAGLRFRVHTVDLPGRPDIVLRRWRSVIFVNGCFWHGHGCPAFRLPSTRIDYWGPKILANRARDVIVARRLRKSGWQVLRVWECQLQRSPDQAMARLIERIRIGAPLNRSQP